MGNKHISQLGKGFKHLGQLNNKAFSKLDSTRFSKRKVA